MKNQLIGVAASLLDDIKDSLFRISCKSDQKIPDLDFELLSQQVISLYDTVQKVKRMNDSSPPHSHATPVQHTPEPRSFTQEKPTPEAAVPPVKENPQPEKQTEAIPPRAEVMAEEKAPEPPQQKEVQAQEPTKQQETATSHSHATEEKQQENISSVGKELNEETRESVDKTENALSEDGPVRQEEEKPSIQQNTTPEVKPGEDIREDKKMLYEKYTGGRVSLNERIGKNSTQGQHEKLQLTPISDLKTAISLNKKIAFINELFGGDQKEYKRTIDFVNNSSNYSEAKFYTQAELKGKYNWNESSPLVKEFMELIYRKFL